MSEELHEEVITEAWAEWNKDNDHSPRIEAITLRAFTFGVIWAWATPLTESVTADVLVEVARATKKFPTWPTDPLHALAVLGEEFGELTKEMVQFTYEPHKTNREKIREEAIQTAAMAMRLVKSLDDYKYTPQPQHTQLD